jgi:hypothetical protein
MVEPGNPYRRGRLSTVDLLIKAGCLLKEIKIFFQYYSMVTTIINIFLVEVAPQGQKRVNI